MIVLMAGLRTRRLPTGPASQLQIKPVPLGRSFLLTAAGQFRIFTGFPFSHHTGAQCTIKFCPYILYYWKWQIVYVVYRPWVVRCFHTNSVGDETFAFSKGLIESARK